MTRSIPARFSLSLLLLASLLAFPAAWASGEEVRERATTAQPEKKESADDETDDATTESAPAEPSVNSLEEIVACRDLPAALGTPPAAPTPVVVWREVAPQPGPGEG
jgi:hypothetical protein